MFTHFGFFHFGGKDKSQPIASLDQSLQEAGDRDSLHDSLIVLPEAFNIRASYEPDSGPYDHDPGIKSSLAKLAEKYAVTFVAGLVIREPGSPAPPFNAGYLIDSGYCHLLCRKRGADNLANTLYTPDAELFNCPVLRNGIGIAALICVDATVFPYPHLSYIDNRDIHSAVRTVLAELEAPAVLCVPANTRYFETTGIADEWHDHHFVLANAGSKPSVIKIKGQDAVRFSGDTNRVVIAPPDREPDSSRPIREI